MAKKKSGLGGKLAGYKLATYRSSEGPRAGLIIGEEVFDAAKLTGKPAYDSVVGILDDWKTAEGVLKQAAAKAGKSRLKRQPVKRTKFLAPVQFPSTIYGAARSAYAGAQGLALPQGFPRRDRSGRPGEDFRLRQADGLGSRTGCRHRQSGQKGAAGQGVVLCRRLYDRQRSVLARPRSPGERARFLAIQVGLDQAQEFRRLLSARTVDRTGLRYRRSAETRPETVGQRRD